MKSSKTMTGKYHRTVVIFFLAAFFAMTITACSKGNSGGSKDVETQDRREDNETSEREDDNGTSNQENADGSSSSDSQNDHESTSQGYNEQDARRHGYDMKIQLIDATHAVFLIHDDSMADGVPIYDSSINDGEEIKSYGISMDSDDRSEISGISIYVGVRMRNDSWRLQEGVENKQYPGQYDDANMSISCGGYHGINLICPAPEVYSNGADIFIVAEIPEDAGITFENVSNCSLMIDEYNKEMLFAGSYIEEILTVETLLDTSELKGSGYAALSLKVLSNNEAEFTLTLGEADERLRAGFSPNYTVKTPWDEYRIMPYYEDDITKPEQCEWTVEIQNSNWRSFPAVYDNGTFTFTLRNMKVTEDNDLTSDTGTITIKRTYYKEGMNGDLKETTSFNIADTKVNAAEGLFVSSRLGIIRDNNNEYYVHCVDGYTEEELDSMYFGGAKEDLYFTKQVTDFGTVYYPATNTYVGESTEYTYEQCYWVGTDGWNTTNYTEKRIFSCEDDFYRTRIASPTYSNPNDQGDMYSNVLYAKLADGRYVAYSEYSDAGSIYLGQTNDDEDINGALTSYFNDNMGCKKLDKEKVIKAAADAIKSVNYYQIDAISFQPVSEDYIAEEAYKQAGSLGIYDTAGIYSFDISGKLIDKKVREVYETKEAALERYTELIGDKKLAGSIVYYADKSDSISRAELLSHMNANNSYFVSMGTVEGSAYTYSKKPCTMDYSDVAVRLFQPEKNKLKIVFSGKLAKESFAVNHPESDDGRYEVSYSINLGDYESGQFIYIESNWHKQYDNGGFDYLGANAELPFTELSSELRIGRNEQPESKNSIKLSISENEQVWDITLPKNSGINLKQLKDSNFNFNYQNMYGIGVTLYGTVGEVTE